MCFSVFSLTSRDCLNCLSLLFSAATAAGGLSILAVSAVPAMYRLGLLHEFPSQDIGKLIALTFCAGFFGVFFVIPLRRYYIVNQKLTFPTPAATVCETCSISVLILTQAISRHTPFASSTAVKRAQSLPARRRSPWRGLSASSLCTRLRLAMPPASCVFS